MKCDFNNWTAFKRAHSWYHSHGYWEEVEIFRSSGNHTECSLGRWFSFPRP